MQSVVLLPLASSGRTCVARYWRYLSLRPIAKCRRYCSVGQTQGYRLSLLLHQVREDNKEEEREKSELKLTKESLIELADKVGETLSKEEIEEMITIVGGSKGEITQEDFVSFMRNPLQYSNSSIPQS